MVRFYIPYLLMFSSSWGPYDAKWQPWWALSVWFGNHRIMLHRSTRHGWSLVVEKPDGRLLKYGPRGLLARP